MSATCNRHALFPDLIFVFLPYIESLTKLDGSRFGGDLNRVKILEKARESRRLGQNPVLYRNSTERRHPAINLNQQEKHGNTASVLWPRLPELEFLPILRPLHNKTVA